MTVVIDRVWPHTAGRTEGELTLGGVGVRALAAEYGTPAYVLDEKDFRARARAWRDALPGGEVHYGSKAFLCPEIASWLAEDGLSLDVCTGGELAVALAGGMPADRITFHGNNKSVAELRRAVTAGVNAVVLDSFTEIERLAEVARDAGARQRVMIRVTPGVDAHTHEFIATGGERSKFGFSLGLGLAAQAVARVLAEPHLELIGLHSHIGSQLLDLEGFKMAAGKMAAFLVECERRHNVRIPGLDLGGGLGIAYRADDPVPPSPAELTAVLHDAVSWLDTPPVLSVEPGRSIAGPTTVALYEIGTVKEIPGVGVYVSVDGGMSDNPRPAMYGAAYTAVLANRVSDAPERPVNLVGKHCESGDVLGWDMPLPADAQPGDLLAIPASGAYQRSMANNYNHVLRPPVLAVRDGQVKVVVRRETEDDLLRLYPR
ncbi:diaminopimelate decarboxylase [Sinosporangium siamense]|uniref:Diaminopimelate decarboxylase n=1 Tax=Sinosporangium siamense TaxID=1367973 RepID=A0A919RF29_9ACTN|nr:diaminopimelate decarboxylase [Sinosporangium siamense]GII90701.1 diaminopimelate decarboxylase [Sinosporangium siamense]